MPAKHQASHQEVAPGYRECGTVTSVRQGLVKWRARRYKSESERRRRRGDKVEAVADGEGTIE